MTLAPPMKDFVVIHVIQLDDLGNPLLNRNGVAIRRPTDSKARVRQTTKTIFNAAGQEVTATLEIDLPSETVVYSGDIVEWVDRFGKLVKGPIADLSETLSASGKKIHFRTALTE